MFSLFYCSFVEATHINTERFTVIDLSTLSAFLSPPADRLVPVYGAVAHRD